MAFAMVKMMGEEGRNFLLTGTDRDTVRTHKDDKFCLIAKAVSVIKVGGKNDGEEITDGIIEQNQTVIIRPAPSLIPKRYHCMVSWDADLAEEVNRIEALQPMINPGEKNKIGIKLTTRKKLDLNSWSYIFKLYMIE